MNITKEIIKGWIKNVKNTIVKPKKEEVIEEEKEDKEVIMNQTHGEDEITQEQKIVAESIAQMCIKWGQDILADQIRIDYGMKNVNRFDLKNSIFYQFAKKNNIHVSQQGWIREGEDMYPIVNVNHDIRDLDKFITDVLTNDKKLSDR